MRARRRPSNREERKRKGCAVPLLRSGSAANRLSQNLCGTTEPVAADSGVLTLPTAATALCRFEELA